VGITKMTNRILIFLALTILMGCQTDNFNIPISNEIKEVVIYRKAELGAESVEVLLAKDEEDKVIPNSINVIFKNCEHVSINDDKIKEYQVSIVEKIIENIKSSAKLFDHIQITFYEGFDYKIVHKNISKGQTFEKDYIEMLYERITSPTFKFETTVKKHIGSQEFQEAKFLCDSVINSDSLNELAVQYRGLINYLLGDTTNAIADFKYAIILDIKNDENYLNLGIIYSELGKIKDAIKYVDKGLSLDSTNAKAIYYRGKLKFETGDSLAACADFQLASHLGFKQAETEFFFACNDKK
jgi:tetratricopeptide (TPR) repeat protein